MKNTLAVITTGLSLLVGVTSVNAVTLYDGSLQPTQTPSQQGWVYQQKVNNSPTPTATTISNGTLLNSGYISNQAGYFRLAPFPLVRDTGYSVSFSVKVDSESHTNSNRAGFSLIVVSALSTGDTHPYSIELGFWQNSIWAQKVGFTRSENVTFNTQGNVNNYTLYVKGNQYQLFANGSVNPILKGNLRQYTGYTPPTGYPNPYTTPNLIFVGDNTTSATAQVTINSVSASPVTTLNLTNH